MSRTTAYFQTLNERIVDAACRLEFSGLVPLVCECPNERCFRLVRTTIDEYRSARAHPQRRFVFPGHEEPNGEELVAQTDRFTLVDRRTCR